MDITEIIKKVKENLKLQEDLKLQLENEDQLRQIVEEKIDFKQIGLQTAQENESSVWDDEINDLKDIVEVLKDNLSVFMAYAYDEGCDLGIFAQFMGKDYSLLANDYILPTKENPRDIIVNEFTEGIFKDYMSKGKAIFNQESLDDLMKIKKLYEIKPQVITEKLVGLDFERKNIKLLKEMGYYKEELAKSVAELKEVEEKIAKTKEFKSELLKKIFTKRAKLQEKRKVIVANNSKLNKNVKELEDKINDKATIKAESTEYVKNELNALMNIFNWIDSFEKSKNALIKYRLEHITVLAQEVQNLKEKLATTNTKIKEIKGTLKLNRQVNNETVLNALMSQDFIKQLNELNAGVIQKGDAKAVKFIENKYHDYLQGQVESLVK